ncbi:hypothetical protein QTP88_007250 [Uroleucon formosanum]
MTAQTAKWNSPTGSWWHGLLRRPSASTQPPHVNMSDWCANLRVKLNRTRSLFKAAISDAKKIIEKTADVSLKGYLHGLLVQTDEAHQTIDSLLSKRVNVLNLLKFEPPQTKDTSIQKVSSADASKDMTLTPGYWDSDAVIESKVASVRRKTRKTKVLSTTSDDRRSPDPIAK